MSSPPLQESKVPNILVRSLSFDDRFEHGYILEMVEKLDVWVLHCSERCAEDTMSVLSALKPVDYTLSALRTDIHLWTIVCSSRYSVSNVSEGERWSSILLRGADHSLWTLSSVNGAEVVRRHKTPLISSIQSWLTVARTIVIIHSSYWTLAQDYVGEAFKIAFRNSPDGPLITHQVYTNPVWYEKWVTTESSKFLQQELLLMS